MSVRRPIRRPSFSPQSPVSLTKSAQPGTIIGIDIGGSKTQAAVFDEDFQPIAESFRRTPTGNGRALVDTALEVVDEILGLISPAAIAAVGIGAPGLVDPTTGLVRQAVNLGIAKAPLDLVTPLRSVHRVPILIGNDVELAGLGAYVFLSRTRSINDLVFLSIGTGVGAGVIIGGKIHRGHAGVSGEIGHFPVLPDGPRCRCGLFGCLETVASGPAIARQWSGSDSEAAARDLFHAASTGDKDAVEVADRVADHLARSIYLLTITFDIELIVLGGGVADAGMFLIDSIGSALERMARQSDFVRDINLADRLLLRPAVPLGALGAATLAASERPGNR